MRKLLLIFTVILCACDLRQRIVDVPADIGGFIAAKYPALLADPGTEIYEYASVIDYGNGDSESLYGMPLDENEYGTSDEYGHELSYADSDDYNAPVVASQTISDVSKDYGTLVVAEKKSFVLKASEVRVSKGDTVYSIAKKHSMPVERLAAINSIKKPYVLSVGQKLKVEKAQIVTTKTEIRKSDMAEAATVTVKKQTPIIKSNSAIKLPKLQARSSNKFVWPVKGSVLSDFGPKSTGLVNDGINIKARQGTIVGAADNGVVAYAGNELKGMGNLLIVQHGGGWLTVYAHLDNFVVRRGDRVTVGQKLGTVGETGRVNEPQLHFEIRKGSKAYNPRSYLKG